MSKLLRANFMRLKQSLFFSVCIILHFFYAAITFFMAYFIYPDKTIVFGRSIIVGSYIMIFLSVFITSFISCDHSCQTIRNKLVVGHTREKIYFSNFIAVWIGSLIIAAVYWITILTLSVFFISETGMPINELCFLLLTQIAAVTALVSLYVLLSELITSKSIAVTTALVLSLIFLVMGNRDTVTEKSYFFNDILPSGQLAEMERIETAADIPRIFPVYSLAVTAVSTAVGLILFKRKDLK